MRRRKSDSVQFVTSLEIRLAFGTMTSAPSKVRTVLERTPMRETLPNIELNCTVSPDCTGRSKARIRPDTKLLTMFCRPKPMPTDSAPTMIAKRSSWMPAAATASTTAMPITV
jgi:hypothetical protein